MRRIIVGAFISLDGVMQAPGGPEEDPSGGFRFGGWVAPHFDEAVGGFVDRLFGRSYDLLLGRRTYDIFAGHWPFVQKDESAPDYDAGSADMGRTFDAATKYVLTHRGESLSWANSQALGADPVARLTALKAEDGPDLVVQGSTELAHLLLENGLVDELWTLTFPVVLGGGKRLFERGSQATSLRLIDATTSASGVVMAAYARAGAIETGSFAAETPSDAELQRREGLTA